jgi:hypothetical protein
MADDSSLFFRSLSRELLFYGIGISIIFGLTGGAGRRPLRGNVFPLRYLVRNEANPVALFISENTDITQSKEEK